MSKNQTNSANNGAKHRSYGKGQNSTLHKVKTPELIEIQVACSSSANARSHCKELSVQYVYYVRRYALHGLSYRKYVCLSVRPSVTLVDCFHMASQIKVTGFYVNNL